MQPGFQNVSRVSAPSSLLLLTSPHDFFTGALPGLATVWRNLLSASLLSAILCSFSFDLSASIVGALLFFVNAVGMTCIFAGCVFVVLRLKSDRTLSIGCILSICACASLGPIFISWIPGAMWVSEPWRWWVAAIGLSTVAPCGMKRAACIVAGAVSMMYGLFWVVLSNV